LTFKEFNLATPITDGLDAMGYTKPTPIQEQTIPLILEGHDLVACAQTGTGKTAAYILPILHKILDTEDRHFNTLILAPTRELALQIDQQIAGLGYFASISSIAVYGGGDGATWDQQKRAMEEGTDIIIATSGRLIAQLAMGTMKLGQLKHLILDEADRMLDMGFYDDLIKIINYLPTKRQTLLFSATMPPKIRTLAARILHNPKEVSIAISKPADGILQQAYLVYDTQKMALLKRILTASAYSSVIIFSNSKDNVKRLGHELKKAGLNADAFHSDLEQQEREQLLLKFRSKQLAILVGTDILSRGIDVEGISLVINYDTPHDAEDYVHRIGRTARAETTGTAITFINDKDSRKFITIEKLIGKDIIKLPLPAELGEGPSMQTSSKPNNPKRKLFRRGKNQNHTPNRN
jgi:ATP-dependent RNA helicase RhlE